jgi:hypothetical protein
MRSLHVEQLEMASHPSPATSSSSSDSSCAQPLTARDRKKLQNLLRSQTLQVLSTLPYPTLPYPALPCPVTE